MLSQQTRILLLAEFFNGFFARLPRIARDAGYQVPPHAFKCSQRIVIIEMNTCRQQRRDVLGQTVGEFFQHALLGRGARDGLALQPR